ncbi:uncharacterized protein BXZ73DRAFT_83666, partial [Epithele typhae]|uniref:uncharacterized protein n=1 Tax=Epithele typhae TaxID=378194 RepID=UPI0020087411
QYWERTMKESKATYTKIKPHQINISNLVELQIAFTVTVLSEGLQSSFNCSFDKACQVSQTSLKRKVGYGDSEEDDTDSVLKRMRLDDSDLQDSAVVSQTDVPMAGHRQCQLSVSDVRWDSLTSYGLSKLTPSVLRWIGGIKTDDRGMLYLDRNILIALWERYHHFYSSIEAACPQLRSLIGGSAVRNPRRDKWHKFETRGILPPRDGQSSSADVEKLGKISIPIPNPFPSHSPVGTPPGQLYWGPIEKTEADFPQKFQPKKLLKLEGEDYVRLAAIHTVTKERLRRLELSEMEDWRKETEKATEKETMKDYMERVENRVHLNANAVYQIFSSVLGKTCSGEPLATRGDP